MTSGCADTQLTRFCERLSPVVFLSRFPWKHALGEHIVSVRFSDLAGSSQDVTAMSLYY